MTARAWMARDGNHAIDREAPAKTPRRQQGTIMADPSRDDKAGEAPSGEEKSWLLGLLVPSLYLVLLGGGVWLILWRPDLLVDPRAQVAVWIVAGGAVGFAVFLFARQWKSGIWAKGP
jgi:hypothetical protein